ncbi:MAG: class I SAM-dependent methyltransferase [Clostridia bacterium]|nr:class I SAM-dependent methyltransferase [Clostridia bacterium]
MDAYGKFAAVYDRLMEDVPYETIAAMISREIKKQKLNNNLVLDLACGTGTLTHLLSKQGFDMIGADISEEMLMKAKEKNPGVLFLNQPMEELELYGTVGAIVCCLDSFNYLTEDGALDEVLHLCNNYLEPGGLLLFDINTAFKFEHILANNIYTFDSCDIYYTWENNYLPDEGLCDFYLTFFVKNGMQYERFDEVHTERCYQDDEICAALERNGFRVKQKYDGFTDSIAKPDSERVFYVCENIDSIQLKNTTIGR